MRFYAGPPLATPNGQKICTLGLVELVPRTLSAEQRAGVHVAHAVMTGMDLPP